MSGHREWVPQWLKTLVRTTVWGTTVQSKLFESEALWINAFRNQRVPHKCRALGMDKYRYFGLSNCQNFWTSFGVKSLDCTLKSLGLFMASLGSLSRNSGWAFSGPHLREVGSVRRQLTGANRSIKNNQFAAIKLLGELAIVIPRASASTLLLQGPHNSCASASRHQGYQSQNHRRISIQPRF